MKIAVYGGSFNPLHIGHLAIISFLTQKVGFDYVYLIVSPKNPLKENISADSGRSRFQAAVESVKRHPELKVKVDDIELNLPAPSYSIKTLDALKAREKENDFTLVMGADNLALIHKWKDYKRILLEFGAVVYPREGFNLDEIKAKLLEENPSYKIQIARAPLINISSTEIRNALAQGKDVTNMLM